MIGKTTGNETSGLLYRETQRMQLWWVWLVVIIVTGLGWWLLIQQIILGHPVGDKPMSNWGAWLFWALCGLGFPLLIGSMALITEVTSEEMVIRFRPLTRRVIPLGTIREAEAREYHPVREYGGWGIKGWSRRDMAYNMSGDRGVQLVLDDGRRILVGSQRAEELARVIETQRLAGK